MELVALEDMTVVAVVMLVRRDVAAILVGNSGVVALIKVVEDEAVVIYAVIVVLEKMK